MPLSLTQRVTGQWDPASTKTLTLTGTPASGDLLVLRFVSDSIPSAISGWTRVDGGYSGGGTDTGMFARLANGSVNSVTLVTSGDTVAALDWWTGNETASLAACLDQVDTSSNENAGTVGPTGTTAQADELALFVYGVHASALWTSSDSEDADLQSPGGPGTEVTGGFYSRVLSATGTVSGTASDGGAGSSGDYSAAVVTFRAAAGGGGEEHSGGGSGSLGLTGAGSGAKGGLGSSSGDLTAASTGSGAKAALGSGSGSLVLAGSGLGLKNALGSGSGLLGLTGSGSGFRQEGEGHSGGGSGSLGLTGSGGGRKGGLGGSSGILQLLGSGSGLKTALGNAPAPLQLIGSGSGRKAALGGSAGSLGLSGSGAGFAGELIVPASRTYVVPVERRVFYVPPERRVFYVPPDPRPFDAA